MHLSFRNPLDSSCNNIDVLLLAADIEGRNYPRSELHPNLIDVQGPFFGLGAYVITNFAARMMLQKVFPIEVQIDAFMGIEAKIEHRLKILSTDQKLITLQSRLESSIQTDDMVDGVDFKIVLIVTNVVTLLVVLLQLYRNRYRHNRTVM